MTYQHSETSRRVLVSLVPVICPPEAEPLAETIVDHMALTLGASPAIVARAFGAGMLAYDLGSLPRHLRRAHQLSPERAEAYYVSWEHGPTLLHRRLAQVINQLMSLSCYEQPQLTEQIGYRVGPWIEEVRKKRLTVFADAIAQQHQQLLAPDPLRPVRSTKKDALASQGREPLTQTSTTTNGAA
jgi:hypothetical protein